MSVGAYRGRFAPSPTGDLHFGSLVAAVASYADALQHDGEWLVRIEDADQTRRQPGSAERILHSLQAFGMRSNATVVRQSDRGDLYAAALERLIKRGIAYRCSCSRSQIAARGRPGIEGPIYPGTCVMAPPPPQTPAAWRLRLPCGAVTFEDRVCGTVVNHPASAYGDFVIKRIDGFIAYQLAVVVDDHAQGITHVVRGADLLGSTPRQILLQRMLDYPSPCYAHVPLVYDAQGHKLSKRDGAHPVDPHRPIAALRAAWQHLGQEEPPPELADPRAFWQWAAPQWRVDRIRVSHQAEQACQVLDPSQA